MRLVRSPWVQGLVVYGLAWAYLYQLQFMTPHMPGTDGYFHIKLAWLMWTEGVPETFRWTTFSLWASQYFDKDFGFHVALIPFTFGDLLFGAKLASVTLGAGIYASFYLVLCLSGVRYAWFWTLLLFGSGTYFQYRTNVPRPQLLSMTMSLWSMFFVLRNRWRPVFVITALYALSYTAPHVVIGYAVFFVGARLALGQADWKAAWPVVAASAGGLLFGWFLHPHFPNNFLHWKVQIVQVLSSAWQSGGPDLALGAEFRPASTRGFLQAHFGVYTAVVLTLFAWRRIERITVRHLTLFVTMNVFFMMTCMTKRFVEYFVPFVLWWCAEVCTSALSRGGLRGKWRVAALGVGLAFWTGTFVESRKDFSNLEGSRLAEASRVIRERAPKDAQIFTCDWDDADLFFFDHEKRYIVFLDPNFFYRQDPELWALWRKVSEGGRAAPYDVIRERFGAEYGVCTANFGRLKSKLEADPRVQVIARGGAYAFFPKIGEATEVR